MTRARVSLHTDGAVSCGTLLWRCREHLQLTVVVKAELVIVPGGVAAPAGPGAIAAEDRTVDGAPHGSLAIAGDLVPYRPRCDVLFTGHAHVHGPAVVERAVRLGVSRDDRWLLDKTILVRGARGPDGAPEPFLRTPIAYEHVRAGSGGEPGAALAPGFGPIARTWLSRRLLLGRIDPARLDATVPDVPEEMPWDYFQAAPTDQQIEPLQGGEWLVLEGVDPTRPRVHTRLPSIRGAAHVILHRPGASSAELALDLVCDTLAVDGDHQVIALVWRGGCEVAEDGAPPPSLTVLAALETPGMPVDWAWIRTTPARAPPSRAGAVAPDRPSTQPPSIAPPRTDATPWSGLRLRIPGTLSSAPLSGAAPPEPIVHRAATGAPPLPLPDLDDADTFVAAGPALDETTEEDDEAPHTLELRRTPAPAVAEAEPPEPPARRSDPPVAPKSEPPPPAPRPAVKAPSEVWARPAASEPPPAPPPARPPPRTFDRPAAAAVQGNLYAKFARK